MTAAHINTWFNLLEASCAQCSITCLDIIVEQVGCDTSLLPSVLSVEPPLLWYSLFTGLPEEGHLDVAPLLIRVDLAQPLQRHWLMGLMNALDGQPLLLVLASHWPFQTLAEHLGQCVDARNGGGSGLLRYYDPRLFPLLLSHLLPEQQQLWLRPVVFWSWLDRDGAPRRLLGTSGMPESADTFGPIELSDSQLETLECASDATLAIRSLGAALPSGWGAERQFQACYAAMREATQANLLDDTEREAFTLDRVSKAWAEFVKTGSEPHA
jgi:hypothetical protein